MDLRSGVLGVKRDYLKTSAFVRIIAGRLVFGGKAIYHIEEEQSRVSISRLQTL